MFKVGDKVKIVLDENSTYTKDFLVGTICTIRMMKSPYNTKYPIKLERNTNFNWRESELRRATVKNTAIARAFYKGQIEKIENGEIYLK